jgi:hypothetical protein
MPLLTLEGRRSLGAVVTIRVGIASQSGALGEWNVFSESDDGCEGPQPSRLAINIVRDEFLKVMVKP